MKITKTDSKVIAQIIEAADIYRPTPDQRLVKAEFLTALKDGPHPEKITAAFAVQVTDRSVIEKWWSVEGFRQWFLDSQAFENRAEAYASSALEIAHEIAVTGVRDGDRLAAAKLLIDIAGKIKKVAPETRFLDSSIPDDPAKLDEYIRKATGGAREAT